MKIKITGQFAMCSRGRIVAKHLATAEWGEREGSIVILDRPGRWLISQTDGFHRKETVYATVSESGEIAGLGRRMEIV